MLEQLSVMDLVEANLGAKEREVAEIVIMLNSAAVRLFECSPRASKISLAQLRQALDILKKLIPRASPLFVWAFLLTQNNRALVLNTTSRHEEAAMVLQSTIKTASALPHEAQQSDAVHLLLVDTWLNYCSSLSNLKKHKRAYTCAVNALKLLERMAIQSTSPLESTRSKAAIQLAIAQFNMGLELQQLKCYTCSKQAFEKSAQAAFNSGNSDLHKRALHRLALLAER